MNGIQVKELYINASCQSLALFIREIKKGPMFRKRLDFLRVFGIKISIDISWLIIAIILSWTLASGYFPYYYPKLSNGTYWTMGIIGMSSLFVCIVLHELGHALVARHFKLPISQITLFIFGGVAEIKKEPTSPKVEFLMAIAGPIVSIIIAIFMYFLTLLGTRYDWPVIINGVTGYLAIINVILAVFNLIPAFPLDGGRVLRAFLWWWKKNLGLATKISTQIGRTFGLILIFLGILIFIMGNLISGIWMVILGIFLHRAASSSQTQFYIEQSLRDEKVLKFMKKDPICVPPDITIEDFINDYVYESHHELYPITKDENLMGYVSLKEIKTVPKDEWSKTTVHKVMIPCTEFKTVSPTTNALQAFNLMNQTESTLLFVVEKKRLVGILNAQDLFKLISLKFELEEPRH